LGVLGVFFVFFYVPDFVSYGAECG